MALDIFPPLVKGETHIMKAAVVVANERRTVPGNRRTRGDQRNR